jgi:hypothetical protein
MNGLQKNTTLSKGEQLGIVVDDWEVAEAKKQGKQLPDWQNMGGEKSEQRWFYHNIQENLANGGRS